MKIILDLGDPQGLFSGSGFAQGLTFLGCQSVWVGTSLESSSAVRNPKSALRWRTERAEDFCSVESGFLRENPGRGWFRRGAKTWKIRHTEARKRLAWNEL